MTMVYGLSVRAQTAPSVRAQTAPDVQVDRNEAWVDFPEAVDFRLVGESDTPIVSATLQYGIQALTCGEVSTQNELTFEETANLDLTVRWEVIPHQIMPPDSIFWWQWELETADGQTILLDKQTATFSDEWFVWRTIERDNVFMHWYRGSESFATELLDAAVDARDQLAQETGEIITEPIHSYLYEDGRDFAVSLPGAPAWAGGVAFPAHNIVMVVTNEDTLEYGLRTVRHEVGHLVIGQLTFNCFQSVPTWLNEGLAQIAEGEIDPRNIDLISEAVAEDKLLSLGQLEGSFSVHGDRASLSYAVGEGVTRHLIDQYGADSMGTLLGYIQEGIPFEDAFVDVYGTPLEVVENEWRVTLGADVLEVAQAEAEATAVPTLSLQSAVSSTSISAAPVATETSVVTATPIPVATATPQPSLTPELTENDLDTTEFVTNGTENPRQNSFLVIFVSVVLFLVVGFLIYKGLNKF